ncbi:hypothetical protein ASD54_23080 [Rhizobium sp. Root149]|uniref:beta strand repeat-containing protein n=1 Tax=Rhizobium sp. Root149 TaxID=1736473 RepID=UPI0007163DC5|nr:DUF4214 domain-containing protein [Rhizobium sp. Root149]KQZ60478.1 hypothetical protein ASD54_23080 [Rhizobium sp. Root149]
MATIQGVYVALFGRPADPTGLAYFNTVTNNGANLTAIGNLASTSEYQARFTGLNNVQIINSIYQSLFGRDADLTGLNFFSNALANGSLNINNIAIAILDGAQGNDRTVSNNKIAAADLYTKALDTGSEVVAYSGLAAAAQGRAFVTGVSTTVPTAAAVDTAVAAMVTASTNGGTGTVGVTLTLAAGADTIGPNTTTDATKTTAGNDTLRAVAAGDLGTSDSIDGGAGTDTLNATMAVTAGASVAAVIKNVENINLTYGTLAGGVTFNANDVSGAQKIQIIDAVTTGQTLTISNVEKAATVEFKNITGDAAGDVALSFRDAAGSADSAAISLAKVTTGLGITVDAIETLTVNSTGAAAADTNVATISAAQATKLVITGANDLTLNQSSAAALKTVDASALTGKLNYTATNNGETISGGTKADTITLGTGADTIVYTAANKSTLVNLDTINGFNATASDKFDIKALAFASDTTVATYTAGGTTALASDFSGFFTGTGKIVKQDLGGGDAMIYIDANNDGNFNAGSDVSIKVTGTTFADIDKADFILA